MVKVLVALVARFKVQLAELAGAAGVVYGVSLFSGRAAVVAGGVAVLAKSMEWDITDRDGGP